jgi:superfamily II DNA or RNA helicase
MEAKAQAAAEKNKKLTLMDIVNDWQELELLKVPLYVDKVRRWREKNYAAVVFVNFTNTREAIHNLIRKENIKAAIAHLHGAMKTKEKDAVVEGFRNDEYDVLIGMIQCAGESVNFHDIIGKKQRRSIVAECMSGIKVRQALGRIDRTGKKSPTKQYMIYVKGSKTEERIADIQAKKIKNLQYVGGGLLTIEQEEESVPAVLHEDLAHLEI